MGQLKTMHPNATEVKMFSTNVKNKENRLVIVLEGERYTLSPKLTELVRNKEITIDQLADYEVRVVQARDEDGSLTGETFNSLGMPSEDITVKINGWKSSEAKQQKKELTVDALAELW